MASITRWAMPPLSWCGYSRAVRSGSGRPSAANNSIALSCASRAPALMVMAVNVRDLLPRREKRIESSQSVLEDNAQISRRGVCPSPLRSPAADHAPGYRMRPDRTAARRRKQAQDRQRQDGLSDPLSPTSPSHLRVYGSVTSRTTGKNPGLGLAVPPSDFQLPGSDVESIDYAIQNTFNRRPKPFSAYDATNAAKPGKNAGHHFPKITYPAPRLIMEPHSASGIALRDR